MVLAAQDQVDKNFLGNRILDGEPYLLFPLAVMDLGLNHTSSGQPFGKRLV